MLLMYQSLVDSNDAIIANGRLLDTIRQVTHLSKPKALSKPKQQRKIPRKVEGFMRPGLM